MTTTWPHIGTALTHDLLVSFEVDAPVPTSAVTWVLDNVTGSIPGHIDTWLEESHESEDQTVPGDRHNEVRARFWVQGSSPSDAAQELIEALRKSHPIQPAWMRVNGDWVYLAE